MSLLFLLAVLAQALVGPQVYTVVHPDDESRLALVMDNGLYGIELGLGCDDITANMNVEYLAGSGNVGAIVATGSDHTCNIYIDSKINDTPCATNDDGVCDVDWQD